MKNMRKLQDKAVTLEAQVATRNLLAYLFPTFSEIRKAPGRYYFFTHIINQHSPLLQALLDNNQSRIQKEWAAILRDYQTDVHFLQALSIIYWEAAQAKLAQEEDAEAELIISTALWVLLLSSQAFWEYFSQDRWTNERGERLPLDAGQQEDLMRDALEDILNLHSIYGKQSLAAGHDKQARMHIRCLLMCQGKGVQLQAQLRAYDIPYGIVLDERKLIAASMMALKILDEWCVALVAEAEKETNDAEAIKQLPQGIRKNYEGGVRTLEPFITLNIPIVRVLSASLDWYNDWCYDLYVLKEKEQLKKLVASARVVADQLMPLCDKEQEYSQENQRISQHFLLRGFVLDDPLEARKEFEEALSWNTANSNAQQLLNDSLLQTALEFAEKEQFEEAERALDAAEREVSDKKAVRKARAAIRFAHGNVLAKEGHFREALIKAKQAAELEPTEPVVQEFFKLMEELAPEEDNIRLLKQADEAFGKERYDEAIQLASRIPSNSKRMKQVREVLAAAYFKRAIAALKGEKPEKAEADFRKALTFNDDDEARQTIKEMLSMALNAQAVKLLDASKIVDRQDALHRVTQAKKLLDEAVSLDRTNNSAKENLAFVKGLPN